MTTQSRASGFDPIVILAALVGVVFVAAMAAIFGYAPQEATMGIVQKIFYFHVPSAIGSYIGFLIAFGASVYYLVRGDRRADVIARAGAEIGVLLCFVVVMSGPLWARKAWGAFWTGEPRLMLTLVLLLIFLAYLVVRQLGGDSELTRRVCSSLAILGVVNIPLVRYSVARWRGNHPRVITGNGGGISSEMQVALLCGFVLIALLFALFFVVRIRQGFARVKLDELEREAALREHRIERLREEGV